jgi:cell division protein FtsI (penicillin-binding protein 3)
MTLAAVAGAYTALVNQGARVEPTLMARAPGEAAVKIPALTPEAAAETLRLMRAVVARGTGVRAQVRGIAIAGKTGTAEKFGPGGYQSTRNFSSFAAIFPADQPRYVLVVALDEPARRDGAISQATGGATAAPAAGRIIARIAPMLGLGAQRATQ